MPPESGSETPPPGRHASRNVRHAYLLGRLRNRQITMEEATELFTIMQEMLQTSEAARLALLRTPAAGRPALPPTEPSERPRAAAAGGGDELLLVGLLAMGAGAGLLAAMTKRITEATPNAGSASASRPPPGVSSGKG